MLLQAYTIFHTLLSLIAIVSGIVVLGGMLAGRRFNGWTTCFLATAVATTVTGFFFPFHGFTPALGLGVISLPFLALACYARYGAKLAGSWRWLFVIAALSCLYFNLFVLIVQSFQKVPFLHSLAPQKNEPPFVLAQGVTLFAMIVLAIIAVRRFRGEPLSVQE